MAALDEMKVKISADISDLVSKLDKGGISLDQFAKQTTAISARIGKDVSTGANQAGNALQNLGRIAQDAPFGFIGISNNINPLLESFQRLKAETGTTGGALKALSGSLLGAGGIGLAVSVVTGLLTVLSANGFFKTKNAVDDTKKSLDDFNKSLKDASAEGLATGASLQSFVEIARNSTLSLEQRNYALKEANKIFGEHGEKLTLVNIATAAVTEQVNKFTQSLIQQSLAAKFADRVADLMIRQKDAAKEYGVALAEYNKQATIARNAGSTIGSGGAGGTGNIAELSKASAKLSELETKTKTYKTVTTELKDVYGLLNASQSEATKLLGDLGTKEKEASTRHTAKVKKIKEEIDLHGQLYASVNRLKNATDQNQFINDAPNPTPPVSSPNGAAFDRRPGIESKLDYTNVLRAMGKAAAETKELNKDLEYTASLGSLISPVFESAFASIANGGNVFSSLGDSLKQLIVQLGQAAIKAAVFSLIFKSIGGGGLGPVGSFGSIFGNLLGFKMPGFADGVTGSPGGFAIVGERGPELVRLPQNSDVIPNHRLSSITGGGTQVFIPNMVLRGADLIVQFERAQRQANRRG